MIPKYRKAFNQHFSQEQYSAFQNAVRSTFQHSPDFRLLETPVFLPQHLVSQLKEASLSIVHQLKKDNFRNQAHHAIPNQWLVPHEDAHPVFLQFDFAITQNKAGVLAPQLIELQGFPALFFFQKAVIDGFRTTTSLAGLSGYYLGVDNQKYIQLLRENILGKHQTKHVILLEFDPWNQKTAIDFAGAHQLLGIPIVDIRQVIRKGRKLFYENKNHQLIPIHRIFNRVIFDEIEQYEHSLWNFNLTQEVDVEWAGHPNWFLKYSKFALPFIQGKFAPKAIFLDQWNDQQNQLANLVLKPIYSFSGNGVIINPSAEIIQKIKDKHQYILQEKINYAPVLASPNNQPSQLEVRVMLVQNPNKPGDYILMTNLVRAGKGGIIGTRHQQHEDWIGGGIALMEV